MCESIFASLDFYVLEEELKVQVRARPYIVALMNADFAIAPSRRATHSLAVNFAVVARSHQKSSNELAD